ncbi:MAG: hypothetical protein Tsb0014_02210 [Pleurocapsa sp.]
MKIKHLSSVLAGVAIACMGSPAWSQSAEVQSVTIKCDTNSQLPKTLATSQNGQEFTIFNWQDAVLPDYLNSAQLCQEVSQKLQTYAASGSEFSSFNVYAKGDSFDVCVEEMIGDCGAVLFSLNQGESLDESKQILDGVLDESLKGEKIVSTDRGVQSYGYRLNLWDMLGF